jgi:hypothetical protein
LHTEITLPQYYHPSNDDIFKLREKHFLFTMPSELLVTGIYVKPGDVLNITRDLSH